MADLIYEHSKDEFTLGDFKTNKKFRFSSPFGERLLAPVDHLHNCENNIYALQLSMYAYFYEQLTGKKCRKLVIFYLSGDRFKAYHCNYLKSDVEKVLENYKQQTKQLKVKVTKLIKNFETKLDDLYESLYALRDSLDAIEDEEVDYLINGFVDQIELVVDEGKITPDDIKDQIHVLDIE